MLIQDLVDKLPAGGKREWVRYKKRKKVITLRTFTNFLSGIVAEACEANVSWEFKPESSTVAMRRSKVKEKGAIYNHSTPEMAGTSSAAPIQPRPCKACQRTDHRLRFCQDFKNLGYADRLKMVQRWKLCKVCLNDHGNAPCKFKIRCNVGDCRDRHNPLLHPVDDTVAINTHIRPSGTILFRMLPVTLHYGGRSVKTLAFLDEGASVTLVEKALAERLGVEGTKQPLTIKWTADVTRVEPDSRRTRLWVSTQNTNGKLLLEAVRTAGELLLPEQTLNTAEMTVQYNYFEACP